MKLQLRQPEPRAGLGMKERCSKVCWRQEHGGNARRKAGRGHGPAGRAAACIGTNLLC